MQKILINLQRLYKCAVSPHLKCSCKFYPTCSEYFVLAVKKYGCPKGILKTIGRILRCNPLGNGGIDFP